MRYITHAHRQIRDVRSSTTWFGRSIATPLSPSTGRSPPPVPGYWLRGSVERFDPHPPHQGAHVPPPDLMPFAAQLGGELART